MAAVLSKAQDTIRAEHIKSERSTTHKVTGDLIDIYTSLKPRWEAFKRYQTWCESGKAGDEPVFADENGVETPSSKALAPCDVVNEGLSRFVGLPLKVFSPEKRERLFKLAALNPDTKEAVANLREIAIHAEEAMEQEALGCVFASAEKASFINDVKATARERLGLAEDADIPKTVDARTALFEALITSVPRAYQATDPDGIKGLVFPYFGNYEPLVRTEMELLKRPFMLQGDGSYHYDSAEELLADNPGIAEMQQRITEEKGEAAAAAWTDRHPEIFGTRDLSDKVFTFVGAGFPLTGLFQHILSGGAEVVLVDYDRDAIDSARRLIGLCERAGIVDAGKIKLLHANALEVEFAPRTASEPLIQDRGASSGVGGGLRYKVACDALQLASALPSEVTAKVLAENATKTPFAMKRNVQGVSEFLYEAFDLKAHAGLPFRMVGMVAPPQKIAGGATPEGWVTAQTSSVNVNSCELYVNADPEILRTSLRDLGGDDLTVAVAQGSSLSAASDRTASFSAASPASAPSPAGLSLGRESAASPSDGLTSPAALLEKASAQPALSAKFVSYYR
jgi:hypothetical protein